MSGSINGIRYCFILFLTKKADQRKIIFLDSNKPLLILSALSLFGIGWEHFSWMTPNRLSLAIRGNWGFRGKESFIRFWLLWFFLYFPYQGQDNLLRLCHVCIICFAIVKQILWFTYLIVQRKVEHTTCRYW